MDEMELFNLVNNVPPWDATLSTFKLHLNLRPQVLSPRTSGDGRKQAESCIIKQKEIAGENDESD
jgi:hypothetical protein